MKKLVKGEKIFLLPQRTPVYQGPARDLDQISNQNKEEENKIINF